MHLSFRFFFDYMKSTSTVTVSPGVFLVIATCWFNLVVCSNNALQPMALILLQAPASTGGDFAGNSIF